MSMWFVQSYQRRATDQPHIRVGNIIARFSFLNKVTVAQKALAYILQILNLRIPLLLSQYSQSLFFVWTSLILFSLCLSVSFQWKLLNNRLLFFLVKPYWITRPSDDSVTLNSVKLLSCQGGGTPSPTVTWKIATGKCAYSYLKCKDIIMKPCNLAALSINYFNLWSWPR